MSSLVQSLRPVLKSAVAGTNIQQLSVGRGKVCGLDHYSDRDGAIFVRLFDSEGCAVIGTTTPIYACRIPPLGGVRGAIGNGEGIPYGHKLWMCATAARGLDDETPLEADDATFTWLVSP